MGSGDEVIAQYMVPGSNEPTQVAIGSAAELRDVLGVVARHGGERGIPALELTGDDGSILVIAQMGDRMVLSWVDPEGTSMHSVGSAEDGQMVVFDYFDSYTEVPAQFAVGREAAITAATAFLDGQSPTAGGLSMELD